jgi:hypothetical protein
MLNLDYSFVWCTCLNDLNLNCGLVWIESLEKIKRKAFRYSGEIENSFQPNSAQPAACARPPSDSQAPPAGANPHIPAFSLSLSLSLWPMGPNCRHQHPSRARLVLSLWSEPASSALIARSCWAVGPACWTIPPEPPARTTHASSWTPRPRRTPRSRPP